MRHSSKKKLMKWSVVITVAVAAIFIAASIFAIPPGTERELIGQSCSVHMGPNDHKTCIINIMPSVAYDDILYVEYEYSGTSNLELQSGGLTMAIQHEGLEMGYVRSNHPSGEGNWGNTPNNMLIEFVTNYNNRADAVIDAVFTINAVVYYPTETTSTTTVATTTSITTTTIPGQTTTTIPGSGEELDPGIILFFVIVAVLCIGSVIWAIKWSR